MGSLAAALATIGLTLVSAISAGAEEGVPSGDLIPELAPDTTVPAPPLPEPEPAPEPPAPEPAPAPDPALEPLPIPLPEPTVPGEIDQPVADEPDAGTDGEGDLEPGLPADDPIDEGFDEQFDEEVDASPEVGPDPALPPLIEVRTDQHSATLSWDTPSPSDAIVVWGKDGLLDQLLLVEMTDGVHDVVLGELDCDSVYVADVVVSDAGGSAHRVRGLDLRTLPCSIDDAEVADRSVIAYADRAIVTWGTANPTRGIVVFGLDGTYGLAVNESHFSTFHQVELQGLDCGTEYHFRILDEAPDGTLGHSDNVVFTTYSCDPLVDTIDVRVGSDWAEVDATTDEPTVMSMIYGVDRTYGSETISATAATSHTLSVVGLECGSTYVFRLIATPEDPAGLEWTPHGELTTADCVIDEPEPTDPAGPDPVGPVEPTEPTEPVEPIEPAPEPDPSPLPEPEPAPDQPGLPEFVGVVFTDIHVAHAEKNAIHIEWSTDIAAAGSVIYGTTPAYGSEVVTGVVSDQQSLTLEGLECGTEYHLAVIAAAPGGELSWSGDNVFSTLACDSATIADISIVTDATSAVIGWSTDIDTRGLVVFGADTSYGSATLAPALSHFHEVVLNDLACGTTYHARVTAETDAGASSWTRDLAFATDECLAEPPPLF